MNEQQKARVVDDAETRRIAQGIRAAKPQIDAIAAKLWARHPNNPAVQARNLFDGIASASAEAFRIAQVG